MKNYVNGVTMSQIGTMFKSGDFKIGLLAILGISFWFFLGYPFGNHNESYLWISEFRQFSFLDVLTHRMEAVLSLRPFGQALAWFLHKISNGSIYPVQLFNYVVAAGSWMLLFYAVNEKRVFSLTSFFSGSLFFSGYIYLFHLHGIFYSPLLLLIALIFLIYNKNVEQQIGTKHIALLFGASAVTSFFHPFSLTIFCAFLIGLMFEKRKTFHLKEVLFSLGCLLASYMLLNLFTLSQGHHFGLMQKYYWLGFASTYRNAELNTFLSVASLFLGFITILSMTVTKRKKIFYASLYFVLAAAFFSIHIQLLNYIPLLILWIMVCVLKMSYLKRWSLVALLVVSFLFPLSTGNGTPTYTIFIVMMCTVVLSIDWKAAEKALCFLKGKMILVFSALLLMLVLILRQGYEIPVISKVSRPLLAEKEKTYQLETIIKWILNSDYNDYKIVLMHNPSLATMRDRNYRPPTNQEYLDPYLASFQTNYRESDRKEKRLVLTFGNEEIKPGEIIFSVKGKYSGEARVYKPELTKSL